MIVTAAAVWTPDEELRPGWVQIASGRVAAVGSGDPPAGPRTDLPEWTLAPGFVDIHMHGGFGHDLMTGGAAVAALSAALPRYGCTSWLATTVTAPWPETVDAIAAIAEAIAVPPPGARPAGLHLEGPFLNPVRRGMQDERHMRPPTISDAARLIDAGGGHVRTVTLAPELPGGLEVIGYLTGRGVRVAMAHSDADYETAKRAADAGARHVTHCFNAMRPLHHRDPGLVGAALDDQRLTVEAIADGVHVHPAALRLLWRIKGWEAMALVTDAMQGAGAPEGVYRFGGREVTVRGGEARLSDGTLAGSVLTMDAAVRQMVAAGVPPRAAVGMATRSPARVAGLADCGRLAIGARADLIALDAHLRVVWTMVGGEVAWRA